MSDEEHNQFDDIMVMGSEQAQVNGLGPRLILFTHDQFDVIREWAGRPRETRAGRASNRPWGKSALINFNNADATGMVDLLQVDEAEPCQFCVTLAPPRTWNPGGGTIPSDLQSLQGPFLTNKDVISAFNGGQANADIALASAVATLEWGVAGGSATAEADFANGLTVNLFASFLRVRARLFASSINNPAVYQLTAFACHGSTSIARAQRTFEVLLAGAVNTTSPVQATPAFAKSVSMTGTTGKAAGAIDVYTGVLRFFRSFGGTPDATNTVDYFFSGNAPGPFPVPNGCDYWQVVNQLAGTTHQVCFDLAL